MAQEQLENYHRFVKGHPQEVKRVEELARFATMMMPASRLGKYSEVFTESMYSILGLVGLYHDRIIQGSVTISMPSPMGLLRFILTLFAHTEVTFEMLSRLLGGQKLRIWYIYFVEVTKAIARLIVLLKSKFKVQVAGAQYQAKGSTSQANETGVAATQLQSTTSDSEASSESTRKPQWQGKRSGKILTLPDDLQSFNNVDHTKIVSKMDGALGKGPFDGSTNATLMAIGEVLYILRPVIYVIHQNSVTDKKSWKPWMVSLLIEFLSIKAVSVASAPVSSNSSGNLFSQLLAPTADSPGKNIDDELRRRKSLLVLYLMRNPLFDKLTLPVVQRVARSMETIPAIGSSIQSIMIDTLMYYHRNHFYISGS